ncbi:hypothetical protein RFI_00963, partial [Reticulomyxa filosa]
KAYKFWLFFIALSSHSFFSRLMKGCLIIKKIFILFLKIRTLEIDIDNFLKEEEIPLIIRHWNRILNIKLGWIHDFDKLISKYVCAINIFIFDFFRLSSKLLKTFTEHTTLVTSIDCSTFGDGQFICSGSGDKTVCVWDAGTNKRIQSFNGHSNDVKCVKFSPYHYHNYRRNVICSSADEIDILFWDIKNNQQLKVFNQHTDGVSSIEFSSFNGGRYLCSGSYDNTIRLWDVETSKSLHVFDEHKDWIFSVDISSSQSNNNKNSNIGVIGGNGYTICSASRDRTIRIWDIETTKQLIVFKGHAYAVNSVKYGSNESLNTVLSGSSDKSVRLWDIRSGQQIQVFNGHTETINEVAYSQFVIHDSEGDDTSNVVCSAAGNTIRFWDIRSNKNELYMINGDEEDEMCCLAFMQLKKKSNDNRGSGIHLCYGTYKGLLHIWG